MALNQVSGSELATKIRLWLKESGQGDPQGELKEFVEDLSAARNVSTWAGVDFERILPLRIRRAVWLRLLSVLRNALVFAPIVLTWLAFREASTGFAERARQQTGDNFLVYWQQIEGFARLSNVAFLDAVLVGIVIFLTLIIGWAEETDRRGRALEAMHEGLMVALERDLSGYRYLSIQDINLAAAGTLSSLLSSSQEIEKAATSFASMAQQAHDAIVGAQQAVTQDFEPVVKRLDATLGALSAAAGMHQDMATLVQTIQRDFAAEISALRSGVSSIIQSFDQQIRGILGSIDTHLGSASQNIAASANTVATQLTTDTVRQLQAVASQLDSSSSSLDKVSADLKATFSTVEIGTKLLRDDLEDIHQFLSRVGR